jgi:hypothetical protein
MADINNSAMMVLEATELLVLGFETGAFASAGLFRQIVVRGGHLSCVHSLDRSTALLHSYIRFSRSSREKRGS